MESKPAAGTIPPGYALVPLEPTPEMLRASATALRQHVEATPPDLRRWPRAKGPHPRGYVFSEKEKAQIRYRAMVKAGAVAEAPEAENPPSSDCPNSGAEVGRPREMQG